MPRALLRFFSVVTASFASRLFITWLVPAHELFGFSTHFLLGSLGEKNLGYGRELIHCGLYDLAATTNHAARRQR